MLAFDRSTPQRRVARLCCAFVVLTFPWFLLQEIPCGWMKIRVTDIGHKGIGTDPDPDTEDCRRVPQRGIYQKSIK